MLSEYEILNELYNNTELFLFHHLIPPQMENSVNFKWKKQPKKKESSEFLINKQQIPRLCAPIKPHEVIPAEIKQSSIVKLKNNVVKYTAMPIRYTYLSLCRTLLRTRKICLNPSLMIGYIHLFLNLFITGCFVYIFGFLIYFLKIDVLYKINEKREVMKGVISNTRHKYIINKCDPSTRVPAMEKQCGEWDNILKNGFSALNYTKIIIELVAGTIDGFISNITYKTLITIGCLMIFYLKYRR